MLKLCYLKHFSTSFCSLDFYWKLSLELSNICCDGYPWQQKAVSKQSGPSKDLLMVGQRPQMTLR